MSKLKVLDMKGSPAGEMEVSDSLLEGVRGAGAVHEAVVNFLAGVRAGTASTLTKGEVSGSGKKPWRQKGTGRARAGYKRSPVWRGGGVVFGPKPRDYSKKVNRKVAKLAFRRALSEKISSGAMIVVDSLELAEAKTKVFAGMMKNLKLMGKTLFVVEAMENSVKLAARNIADVEIVRAQDVDVYRLLRYPNVVVTKAGMELLVKRLESDGGESK